MGYVLVTPPASEPVELETVKLHLSELSGDRDVEINALIKAARAYVERFTGRSLVEQTWRATFDRFPAGCGALRLAKGPVLSIDAVTYYDDQNAAQTLAAPLYAVDLSLDAPRIAPAVDESWPTGVRRSDAVAIEFTAGHDPDDANLQLLVQAMLLLIGHWYANREAVSEKPLSRAPFAVDAILDSLRIPLLA